LVIEKGQGEYWGEELDSKDIQLLCRDGNRDFRGAILQGCNLSNEDLSEADFSEADIRSTQFVNANLRGANFSKAKTGLTAKWWLLQSFLIVLATVLTGFFQAYSAALIIKTKNLLDAQELMLLDNPESAWYIMVGTQLATKVLAYTAIITLGFTIRALRWIVLTATVAGLINFFITGLGAVLALSIVIIIFISIAAIATTVEIANIWAFLGVGIGSVMGTSSVLTSVWRNNGEVNQEPIILFSMLLLFGNATIVNLINSKRSNRKFKPIFDNLRIIAIDFLSLGNTNFKGTDLSNANFTNTNVKNTNFVKSNLACIRWQDVEQLGWAKFGITNLQDPRVRQLVTTLDGQNQDLEAIDLRGTNLEKAQLQDANLRDANLNGVNLTEANLTRANLTESSCIGVDFKGANLTGACLESWNYNEHTNLDKVYCDYIFLKQNTENGRYTERIPHNPDTKFDPDDFTYYFKQLLQEIYLLIYDRNNPNKQVDMKTIHYAFEELTKKHKITPQDILGIEIKSNKLFLKIRQPSNEKKADIAKTWDNIIFYSYEEQSTSNQPQIPPKIPNHSKPEPEDNKVREQPKGVTESDFFEYIIKILQEIKSPTQIYYMGDGSVNAVGNINVNSSVINLGEISGEINNYINQLPDELSSDRKHSLKEILVQLQDAIKNDTELSYEQRITALQALSNLIIRAMNQTHWSQEDQNIIEQAKNDLKEIANNSKCQKLLTKLANNFPSFPLF